MLKHRARGPELLNSHRDWETKLHLKIIASYPPSQICHVTRICNDRTSACYTAFVNLCLGDACLLHECVHHMGKGSKVFCFIGLQKAFRVANQYVGMPDRSDGEQDGTPGDSKRLF
jgi:hypothetical protein